MLGKAVQGSPALALSGDTRKYSGHSSLSLSATFLAAAGGSWESADPKIESSVLAVFGLFSAGAVSNPPRFLPALYREEHNGGGEARCKSERD